ncbi:MAG: ATP-binding protein [Candidatus Nitrospinota bacterium M3_3B_026]
MMMSVKALQENVTESLRASAEQQISRVRNNLNRVSRDTVFLSEISALKRFLRGDRSWLGELENEFLEFNRLHPEYYQIRLLGLGGHEVVRSNYKNQNFFLTARKDLQYKGHRYYYQKSILLNKGDIYFSPIDLNMEYSKVETPPQLVVRVSTPVYVDGAKRGVVVINIFAKSFFEWISLPQTRFTTLLLDENGKILHADENGGASVLGETRLDGKNVSDVLPFFSQEKIKTLDTGIFQFGSAISAFQPIRGVGGFQTPAWYIITLFPKPYLSEPVRKLESNLLALGMIVAALLVVLGVALAKRFTRPIRQLYMEADLIAEGNLDHELEIKTGDEIEDLAEKFNRMRLQIKEKQKELEKWNQELNRKLDWHIAELRSLERQLYRADKLASLGELSMRLAHEIGNPLASLKTVAQAMSDSSGGSADRPEYFRRITSEVDRLNTFLKKFNKFAVMKELDPAFCDLRDIVHDVCFFLRIQARERGVVIDESHDPDLGKILVDPQQVKQALINMILNAIQAVPEKGRIHISLKSIDSGCVCSLRGKCFCKDEGTHPGADKFLELAVCDNGGGIAEEDLLRVFDPFYTTKTNGTGLGLSVVHRIVENHHGIIRVFSKVGEGTTIKIYFPKREEPALT